MVMLDAAEKAGDVRILQLELNDRPGVVLKITGPLGSVQAAAEAACAIARSMQIQAICDVIAGPDPAALPAIAAVPDYSPLIDQYSVQIPNGRPMNPQESFAVGLIETQGFTAVFEAIDTAVKTAAVEVLAREKLGGGYITVVLKGDVAAVRAAVDAGSAKVNGLGKLIAAHVIPNPSPGVLSLLPIAK